MVTPVSREDRFFNHILDSIGVCLCFFIYSMIFDAWLGIIPEGGSPWLAFFSFVTLFCYFFLFEYFFGKTPAKFITKTTVVDINGQKPTVTKLIIRTLSRAMPLNNITFLFEKSGFHDIMSDTRVIKDTTSSSS